MPELDIYQHVLDMRALDKGEKDMFLMGKLCSFQMAPGGVKKKRYSYVVGEIAVCQKAYLLYHDLGEKQLCNLSAHVKEHGITPRRHGNTGRSPAHAIKYEDTRRLIQFLRNYATENGMPLAAAPGGSTGSPPILLPAKSVS